MKKFTVLIIISCMFIFVTIQSAVTKSHIKASKTAKNQQKEASTSVPYKKSLQAYKDSLQLMDTRD
ncbi:MAG: hypothetical protein AAGI07_17140 [Bacteroidota bacterium]